MCSYRYTSSRSPIDIENGRMKISTTILKEKKTEKEKNYKIKPHTIFGVQKKKRSDPVVA